MRNDDFDEYASKGLEKPVEKLDAQSSLVDGKSRLGEKDAIEHVRVQLDPALIHEKYVPSSAQPGDKTVRHENPETVGKRWVPNQERDAEHVRVQLDPALIQEKHVPPNLVPEGLDVLGGLAPERGALEGRQLRASGVVGGESVIENSEPAATPVDQGRLRGSKNTPATRR